ncbi:MAG: RagB/SusD family nutrient uptake outer membrane protein [Bacteroidales bacterium]|nr:RagB/SusD family nutrient uptake outer membrane protein [Bacteroidales bacterium]
MKSIFKHIALVAGIALLCVSCEDKLNIPPVGSLPSDGYFTTPSHVEEGVRGVYAKLRGAEVNHYATLSEMRSDNIWVDPAPNATREASEIAHYRFGPTLGNVASAWSSWYSVIYNANTVLENIEAVEFSKAEVKNQFKAELLFLRAYSHFELVRLFGDVPLVDHVLGATEASQLKQTKGIDVIKNLVIPDLKEAINALPYQSAMLSSTGGSASAEMRADKLAAQAMLARVYMTILGFPYNDSSVKSEAKNLLKSVVDYGMANGYWAPTATEWKKMFTTDRAAQNKYFLFSIQHTASSTNNFAFSTCGNALSIEYLPTQAENCYFNGNSMTPAYVEASLRHEYQATNDERAEFTVLDIMNPIGSFQSYFNRETEFTMDGKTFKTYERSLCTKWIPYATKRASVGVVFDDLNLNTARGDSGGWPMNFPIIRLEDMMLLYAELIASEDVATAMGYVNKIRERAGVPARSTSCAAAEALEFIKMERKLEFLGEGIRWFDEIRYGEWKDATVDMMNRYLNSSNPGYQSTVSTLAVLDGKYLCPIPQSEMEAVPGLYVQNSNWE